MGEQVVRFLPFAFEKKIHSEQTVPSSASLRRWSKTFVTGHKTLFADVLAYRRMVHQSKGQCGFLILISSTEWREIMRLSYVLRYMHQ